MLSRWDEQRDPESSTRLIPFSGTLWTAVRRLGCDCGYLDSGSAFSQAANDCGYGPKQECQERDEDSKAIAPCRRGKGCPDARQQQETQNQAYQANHGNFFGGHAPLGLLGLPGGLIHDVAYSTRRYVRVSGIRGHNTGIDKMVRCPQRNSESCASTPARAGRWDALGFWSVWRAWSAAFSVPRNAAVPASCPSIHNWYCVPGFPPFPPDSPGFPDSHRPDSGRIGDSDARNGSSVSSGAGVEAKPKSNGTVDIRHLSVRQRAETPNKFHRWNRNDILCIKRTGFEEPYA